MRGAAVLENINALPGPKNGTPSMNGYRQLRLSQSRPDVSRHVVGPLHSVAVVGVVFWSDAAEVAFEVVPHVGVGVFLNRQRRGSVANEDSQQAFAQAAVGHPADNRWGDFVQTLAAGRELDFVI